MQCVSLSVCVGEHAELAVCVVDDSSVGAGFVLLFVVETGVKHSTFACEAMSIPFDLC